MCTLLIWMDAKFSGGFEKSYCKVVLCSPELYPLHRSDIARYIDIEGHESAFLSLSEQITVCEFTTSLAHCFLFAYFYQA